ncbi:MAG: hypothetical protein QGG40_07565 [Myxococcota bacterium]|jgi:hypothetical protein|nr:hypothetical protein [Myxococcota bacterium]
MHTPTVLGWLGLWGCTSPETGDTGGPGSCEEGLQAGYCAPDFELPEASGQQVALSDHAGRIVLLASETLW